MYPRHTSHEAMPGFFFASFAVPACGAAKSGKSAPIRPCHAKNNLLPAISQKKWGKQVEEFVPEKAEDAAQPMHVPSSGKNGGTEKILGAVL